MGVAIFRNVWQCAPMNEVTSQKGETTPARGRTKMRFFVIEYTNRGGSLSYRVTGMTRDGKQLRENFSSRAAADCRVAGLNLEFLGSQTTELPRLTKLTPEQLRFSEIACAKLAAPGDLLRAVDFWIAHSKERAASEAPDLDDAFAQFEKWVDATDELRPRSKRALLGVVRAFVNTTPNLKINDIAPERIHTYLTEGLGAGISPQTRMNWKLGLSRFFSWCAELPRRWIPTNPCKPIKLKLDRGEVPQIIAVEDCQRLMAESERYMDGALTPYLSVCLFAALRPSEAERLNWAGVNLDDRELHIAMQGTKTKRPRVVTLCETTLAWLRTCEGKPFHIANHRRHMDALKRRAGFAGRGGAGDLKTWTQDGLRHTGISHAFRRSGKYGHVAEWAGNSENVIRTHYASQTTTAATALFYQILPSKKATTV